MPGLNTLRRLWRRWPDDARVPTILSGFPRPLRHSPDATGPKILVQCVADPYFLGIFAGAVAGLSRKRPVRVDLFVLRSIDAAAGLSGGAFLQRSFAYSGWLAQQWVRVYRDLMAASVGYRSVSWAHPWLDCQAFVRALRLWRGLSDAAGLEALVVDDILVGDLVIDTYLRFRPAAQIDVSDPFLGYVIWQAIRDVARAGRYFARARPDLYLTSFATYVQHGIAARVAISHDVPVVAFGNLQELGKRLTAADPFQTKNPLDYREAVRRRPDIEAAVDEARRQLEGRLSGGVDLATAYMAASAYSSAAECPDVSGAVVVFLHDFFDSPHIYADLVFSDFWSWACATLDVMTSTGRKFFVKPHPNQVAESAAVLGELKAKYPSVEFLPSGVSNAQLAAGGMRAAVTVYGTVAHEVAYLGVPAIACARHPHVAFDFCVTARTREEYVDLLLGAHEMRFDRPDVMKRQVLEFYVAHNLEGDEHDLAGRTALVAYWRECLRSQASGGELLDALDQLCAGVGFQRLVRRLELLMIKAEDGKQDHHAETENVG